MGGGRTTGEGWGTERCAPVRLVGFVENKTPSDDRKTVTDYSPTRKTRTFWWTIEGTKEKG